MSCRILAIFSDQYWIWILIFEKKGSGYLFDLYNEISMMMRVIQDVTNYGGRGRVFFAMVFVFIKTKTILSLCAPLITINDNSCYFIVHFFRRSSKLPLYC